MPPTIPSRQHAGYYRSILVSRTSSPCNEPCTSSNLLSTESKRVLTVELRCTYSATLVPTLSTTATIATISLMVIYPPDAAHTARIPPCASIHPEPKTAQPAALRCLPSLAHR